jgi:hypothetical protein
LLLATPAVVVGIEPVTGRYHPMIVTVDATASILRVSIFTVSFLPRYAL